MLLGASLILSQTAIQAPEDRLMSKSCEGQIGLQTMPMLLNKIFGVWLVSSLSFQPLNTAIGLSRFRCTTDESRGSKGSLFVGDTGLWRAISLPLCFFLVQGQNRSDSLCTDILVLFLEFHTGGMISSGLVLEGSTIFFFFENDIEIRKIHTY